MSGSNLFEKNPVLLFFKPSSGKAGTRYRELVVVCPSFENPEQILIKEHPYYLRGTNFDRREWMPEDLVKILNNRFVVAFDAKHLASNIRTRLHKAGYRCRFHAFCLTRLFQRVGKSYDIDVYDPLTSYQKLIEIVDQFEADDLEMGLKPLLKQSYLPPHLSLDDLSALPDQCGVYFFYGLKGKLLYVGKSIHIRQRVISHFQEDGKNRRESKMCSEIRRIDYKLTAGELGALLLESDSIKRMKPTYNLRLRETNKRLALCLQEDCNGYLNLRLVVGKKAVDTLLTSKSRKQEFITLFNSKREADGLIKSIVSRFNLCKKLCGIESGNGPCFGFQLKKCEGACCGNEPNGAYNSRLNLALENIKFATWPFPGRIALKEQNLTTGDLQYHVVDQWRYVGSANSRNEAIKIKNPYSKNDPFDLDCYKILKRHLFGKSKKDSHLKRDFRYRTLQIDKPKKI